jgi:hypothetical protein
MRNLEKRKKVFQPAPVSPTVVSRYYDICYSNIMLFAISVIAVLETRIKKLLASRASK